MLASVRVDTKNKCLSLTIETQPPPTVPSNRRPVTEKRNLQSGMNPTSANNQLHYATRMARSVAARKPWQLI
jgi:hypothetical protein